MADTYCGKICSECTRKEILNCPGCKEGPGRQYDGDCELAKCCRDKGHEVCDTCGFKGNCGTLRSKDQQPDYRKRKIEAELRQKQEVAKRAPFLGKWLWVLFWLVIPTTIAGLMENDLVAESAPSVFFAGQILSMPSFSPSMFRSIRYFNLHLLIMSQQMSYNIFGHRD